MLSLLRRSAVDGNVSDTSGITRRRSPPLVHPVGSVDGRALMGIIGAIKKAISK